MRASAGVSAGRSELSKSIAEYLALDPNCVHCPNPKCNNVFENAGPGDEDKELMLNGEPISDEARDHRRSFRFRCRECSLEFCSSCGETPYHLGYTCDSYKAYVNSVKCRFCQESLPGVSIESLQNSADPSHDYCDNCKDKAALCKSGVRQDCLHTFTNYNQCNMYTDQCRHVDCAFSGMQTEEDDCIICFTELRSQPWIESECGHIFHYKCIMDRIKSEYKSYITLTHADCPICNAELKFQLQDYTDSNYFVKINQIRTDLFYRIKTHLKSEDIDLPADIDAENQHALVNFGLSKFNYYNCHKCKSPYFGGKRECGEQPDVPKDSLVCLGCIGCKIHGGEHMIFKCRFCCSPATWFCFGHTHFCEPCHNIPWEIVAGDNNQYIHRDLPVCKGDGSCALGIPHAPTGEEFPIGCALCAEEKIKEDNPELYEGFNPNAPPKPVVERAVVPPVENNYAGRVIDNPNNAVEYQRHRLIAPRNNNFRHFLPAENAKPIVLPRVIRREEKKEEIEEKKEENNGEILIEERKDEAPKKMSLKDRIAFFNNKVF